jgi:hypothetical protein
MYSVSASFQRNGDYLDASEPQLYIQGPDIQFKSHSEYAFTINALNGRPLHHGSKVFIRSQEGLFT